MYICNYTLEFAICTENMELIKLYSKIELLFFCQIKLVFIKFRCLINVNVSLEAILEGQGSWKTPLFNIICLFKPWG